MLTEREFNRLQQLANIKLSQDEASKLEKQLDSIIDFLGQLDQIKIGKVKNKKTSDLFLRTIDGVRAFPDTKKLLDNVKHPIQNNSIVIKSALS